MAKLNKGQLSTGAMYAIIGALVSIGLVVTVVAYKQGWLQGAQTGITGPLGGVSPAIYGSAIINNYPEGLSCYDYGSGEVILRYANVYPEHLLGGTLSFANDTEKDFKYGYLTIKADGGVLSYITVTATTNDTGYFKVLEASPNELFENADYEQWPVPPNYLAEGEALTYRYNPRILSGTGNWTNNTVKVVRITVDIPEEGEPIPGCNRDVGDGVCDYSKDIVFRNLLHNCSFHQSVGNLTAEYHESLDWANATNNCYSPMTEDNYVYCSLNDTCAYGQNTSSTCY